MLKRLEIVGFKSFAKKTILDFSSATTAIVGPNGSGKSNIAEAFRFALGEQSMKSMRGKRAEDLIWNGSHSMPRASRTAVSVIFDNTSKNGARPFGIDFDEVRIERAAFRDGVSEYSINGSRVRLRDIEELLASANIGETGHHIISQGEADRILLASPRERRAMLEDALGLAAYEFKKHEAQKKLVKTEENIAQVNALRRELAPHLRFLEKQVAKMERADALRGELLRAAQTYFAIEDAYLVHEHARVVEGKRNAAERLAAVSAELASVEERTNEGIEGAKRLERVRTAEQALDRIANEREELARRIGRAEGALTAARERSERIARDPYAKVPREHIAALAHEVEKQASEAMNRDASRDALAAALAAIRKAVKLFVDRFVAPADDLLSEEEQAAHTLTREREVLAAQDTALAEAYEKAHVTLTHARESLAAYDETGRELNRRVLSFAQEKAREENALAQAEARERELTYLSEELERSKGELGALLGVAVLSYLPAEAMPEEDRHAQEERRRTIERMHIRLEEVGGGGEDIRHEHKEISEREAFLAGELDDLSKSAAGLAALIRDLDAELSKHFSDGLAKVNASFSEYFALMFGGGSARLALEELEEIEEDDEHDSQAPDEAEVKAGIEIAVSVPKKKIRSLVQLSGGERALTSIALIFAMSQVNPPPFLILDETDAALDEANSQRYGNLIEDIAQKSQLIVITHNRETMSRTKVLYGITMGSDGISKPLSVKFDEAAAVAK